MSGFVGQVCVLNVMLECAGHIFMLHGKCLIAMFMTASRTSAICHCVEIYTNLAKNLFHSNTLCTLTHRLLPNFDKIQPKTVHITR